MEPSPSRLTLTVIVALFGILTLLIPIVQADDQLYQIPLYRARWAISTIDVAIPSSPATAHEAVSQALDVWNQAQIWFTSKYFPNGHVYSFEAVDSGAINVVFSTSGEIENLTSSQGNLGYADLSISAHVTIDGGEVYLDVNGVNLYLALHEFGHILGLGHVAQDGNRTSCTIPDLMCHWVNPAWPSTLDLYALHLLAEGQTPLSVTLPTKIPYEASS